MNRVALKRYWDFVAERHKVWFRRVYLGQPAPWTKDPIIREAWFTNMYRELDPGTEWVKQVVYENKRFGIAARAFTGLFYRFIGSNRYTMAGVGILVPKTYHPADVTLKLEESDTPFGSAYNVHPIRRGVAKTKATAYGFNEIADQWDKHIWPDIQDANEPSEVCAVLRELPGIGPFVAYQAFVDYSMMGFVPFDRDEWAQAGPGAKRGLNVIFGAGVKNRLLDATALEQMHRLWEAQEEALGERGFPWDMSLGNEGKLWLSDIQNTLCEFSKYSRIRETGRIKRKYLAVE